MQRWSMENRIKWYNKEVIEAVFNQPYGCAKTVGNALNKSSSTTLTQVQG